MAWNSQFVARVEEAAPQRAARVQLLSRVRAATAAARTLLSSGLGGDA